MSVETAICPHCSVMLARRTFAFCPWCGGQLREKKGVTVDKEDIVELKQQRDELLAVCKELIVSLDIHFGDYFLAEGVGTDFKPVDPPAVFKIPGWMAINAIRRAEPK